MGGIYLGNALLTHSKVENIIQDNDFYIKADGNNINWVDKEVCTLNISEPTNFTLNDILVAKQEYRDIILQIDNLDTNGVKITNYLVLESFNSNTLINQFSNDNFIATINSNATITLQKNIKAAPIEDYIVATDEGELTTELPETFGGRTADEYALKSDLENVGSGGGVTSWNDLEDKPFETEYSEYIISEIGSCNFTPTGDNGVYSTVFACYELFSMNNDTTIVVSIDGVKYADTIESFGNNNVVSGLVPTAGEHPIGFVGEYGGGGNYIVTLCYYGDGDSHEIVLCGLMEKNTTIDSKYLPPITPPSTIATSDNVVDILNELINNMMSAGYLGYKGGGL